MDYQGQNKENKAFFSGDTELNTQQSVSLGRDMTKIGNMVVGAKSENPFMPSTEDSAKLERAGTEALNNGFVFEEDSTPTAVFPKSGDVQERSLNVGIEYENIKNEASDKLGKVALAEIKKAENYLNEEGDVRDFYKTIREEAMPALLKNNYGRNIGKAA